MLLLGHRLHGRSQYNGDERAASITADGSVTMSGDWILGGGTVTGGTLSIGEDEVCSRFPSVSYCGAVLRNPGGLRAKENEFIWLIGSAFTFSPVE